MFGGLSSTTRKRAVEETEASEKLLGNCSRQKKELKLQKQTVGPEVSKYEVSCYNLWKLQNFLKRFNYFFSEKISKSCFLFSGPVGVVDNDEVVSVKPDEFRMFVDTSFCSDAQQYTGQIGLFFRFRLTVLFLTF